MYGIKDKIIQSLQDFADILITAAKITNFAMAFFCFSVKTQKTFLF